MGATSLTRAREFARVQASGRRARSNGIAIVVAPGLDESAAARLGLAVGRSLGGAVVRNRIKRRVRAAWRTAGPPPGLDAIVRPAQDVATMDFQDLVTHVKRALSRATAGTSSS